jgi:hypothetical protein
MDVNEVHVLNAPRPIEVTLSGIAIDVSEVQEKKA